MAESQVVNEWISKGVAKGVLAERRRFLLQVLHVRFPGAATDEIARLVNGQDNLALLEDWLQAALRAYTLGHILDVLEREAAIVIEASHAGDAAL